MLTFTKARVMYVDSVLGIILFLMKDQGCDILNKFQIFIKCNVNGNSLQSKISALPYFCFFNNIRTQTYLSHTLAIPYFNILNNVRPNLDLILAVLIEKNSSRSLLLHFQQNKTPTVPYFNIFNRINPQTYLILSFSIK